MHPALGCAWQGGSRTEDAHVTAVRVGVDDNVTGIWGPIDEQPLTDEQRRDPEAKAYYWHRFFSHQPDLNYDNPKVDE